MGLTAVSDVNSTLFCPTPTGLAISLSNSDPSTQIGPLCVASNTFLTIAGDLKLKIKKQKRNYNIYIPTYFRHLYLLIYCN